MKGLVYVGRDVVAVLGPLLGAVVAALLEVARVDAWRKREETNHLLCKTCKTKGPASVSFYWTRVRLFIIYTTWLVKKGVCQSAFNLGKRTKRGRDIYSRVKRYSWTPVSRVIGGTKPSSTSSWPWYVSSLTLKCAPQRDQNLRSSVSSNPRRL